MSVRLEPLPNSASFHGRTKRVLTNDQRRAIFEMLLRRSENGKLKWGCLTEIAAMYSDKPSTIRKIWQRAGMSFSNGLGYDVHSHYQNCGRKRVEINSEKVAEVQLRKRTNIRSFARAMNMAKSTLHRRCKEGAIRPHTNALKPFLTEENKQTRLRFCLSMVEPSSLTSQPIFKDMYNYVHVDERWFFLSRESERYYLLPEEHEPLRTCKSKRFITKVMFLAAVAQPRFDATGNEEFSGKIGIWPFTFKERAKRNSKNRAQGPLETKAITAVTKEIYRSYLIEKVFPAIQAKWPRCNLEAQSNPEAEIIFVQHDNARPHMNLLNDELVEASCKDGFDIRLVSQPPNSPDMNVLDLGFFRAIQSLQYEEAPTTIDELVNAVEKSFENLSSMNLNQVFLTLQSCMIEVMKVHGGINYKVPHMGKNSLIRHGNLPIQLDCDHEVLESALAFLQ